jgi:hypothetical protein
MNLAESAAIAVALRGNLADGASLRDPVTRQAWKGADFLSEIDRERRANENRAGLRESRPASAPK